MAKCGFGWGATARRLGLTACIVLGLSVGALAAVPEGIWTVGDRVAVRIFDCSGDLCGQVIWLQNPALRTPAICGRTIIWGLRSSGPEEWSGGWFFDPENGSTYNVSARLTQADVIAADIYRGLPIFGRHETLRRTSLGALARHC